MDFVDDKDNCGKCGKQFGYNEPSWFDEEQGDKYHICDDCVNNKGEIIK